MKIFNFINKPNSLYSESKLLFLKEYFKKFRFN